MRMITKVTAHVFRQGWQIKSDNTEVAFDSFRLHGNLMAKRDETGVYISNAGWATNTTKERLNGILEAFSLPQRISKRNCVWYLGNEVFPNNEWVKII